MEKIKARGTHQHKPSVVLEGDMGVAGADDGGRGEGLAAEVHHARELPGQGGAGGGGRVAWAEVEDGLGGVILFPGAEASVVYHHRRDTPPGAREDGQSGEELRNSAQWSI